MSLIRTNAAPIRRAHRTATVALAISAILLAGAVPAFAQKALASATSKSAATSKVDALVAALMDMGLGRTSAEQLAKQVAAGDVNAKKTAALLQQMSERMQAAGVSSQKRTAVLEDAAARRLTDASPGAAADKLVSSVLPVVSAPRTSGRLGSVEGPPPGGPKSPVSVPDVRADVNSGVSDRTAKDAMSGGALGSSAEALRGKVSSALSESTAERAEFDQGREAKPEFSDADVASVTPGNPLSRMTGGQVVGGPLGAAAAGSQKAPGGSGAAASGKVSDGSITAPTTFSDSEGVRGVGTSVRDAYAGGTLQGVADLISGSSAQTNRGQALQSALCAESDCASSGAGTPATNTASNGPTSVTHPSGNTSTSVGGGSSQSGGQTTHTTRDSQGRPVKETVVTNNGDGTRTVETRAITYTSDDDGVGAAGPKTSTTGFCPQDENGCGGPPSDFEIEFRQNNQSYQIVQQAKAGGAVNPDRNDGLGVGNKTGAIPGGSQGLVGNPGVDLNDAGSRGNTGLHDRNNGAIDPGRDAVHTGGGGQQQNRAEEGLNNRVSTPSVPLQTPADDEDEDKDKDKEDDKDTSASGG